jgi:hypothetical protein
VWKKRGGAASREREGALAVACMARAWVGDNSTLTWLVPLWWKRMRYWLLIKKLDMAQHTTASTQDCSSTSALFGPWPGNSLGRTGDGRDVIDVHAGRQVVGDLVDEPGEECEDIPALYTALQGEVVGGGSGSGEEIRGGGKVPSGGSALASDRKSPSPAFSSVEGMRWMRCLCVSRMSSSTLCASARVRQWCARSKRSSTRLIRPRGGSLGLPQPVRGLSGKGVRMSRRLVMERRGACQSLRALQEVARRSNALSILHGPPPIYMFHPGAGSQAGALGRLHIRQGSVGGCQYGQRVLFRS